MTEINSKAEQGKVSFRSLYNDTKQELSKALEHFGFCSDRIEQDENDTTIGKLASTLMSSNKWRFWWD